MGRERLIIEARPSRTLLGVLATLAPLDEDFPPVADVPPGAVGLRYSPHHPQT
jgi:hypothetical protein